MKKRNIKMIKIIEKNKRLNDDYFTYHFKAAQIIDVFENMLDSKNIDIPCDDENEQKERNARIYGTEYFNLEDKIANMLVSFDKIKK